MRRRAAATVLATAFLLLMGVTASTGFAGNALHIAGKEFAFDPPRVTAKVGEKLEIVFENDGAMSHNLSFKSLDGGTKTIQKGETARFAVTPDSPGEYTYICTVPGHAQAGMKGTLVVE